MRSVAVTVGTERVLAVSADDQNRTIYIHHQSQNDVYVGGSDLSTSNGLHVEKDSTIAIVLPLKEVLYAISSHADQEIRILLPDGD